MPSEYIEKPDSLKFDQGHMIEIYKRHLKNNHMAYNIRHSSEDIITQVVPDSLFLDNYNFASNYMITGNYENVPFVFSDIDLKRRIEDVVGIPMFTGVLFSYRSFDVSLYDCLVTDTKFVNEVKCDIDFYNSGFEMKAMDVEPNNSIGLKDPQYETIFFFGAKGRNFTNSVHENSLDIYRKMQEEFQDIYGNNMSGLCVYFADRRIDVYIAENKAKARSASLGT